ncbi:MAG: aminotransferase class III-fold pyridoxal phosphate-dependent enzyme [Planctomycetota bacterium]
MQQTHPSAELPVYARIDVPIERGEGVHVYTTDGQRLIDFYGGHAVAGLGYAHPLLTGALACQAGELFFQTNLVDVPIRRRAHQALVGSRRQARTRLPGEQRRRKPTRTPCGWLSCSDRVVPGRASALSTVVPRPRAR